MECLKPIGKAQRIAQLNDELRSTFRGGRVLMTAGVNGLSAQTRIKAVQVVQSFSDFTPDNDPYGEHDFGRLEVDGACLMFKIDYYDLAFTYHSPDPADASVTQRVLTLMLAEEY